MNEEQLVEQLLALGWKWGYVNGHGTDEPASGKGPGPDRYVIADVEKTNVLIRPSDLIEDPETEAQYYGWPETKSTH